MNNDAAAEDLVLSLQVLEVTSPALHSDILPAVSICFIYYHSKHLCQYLEIMYLLIYNNFVFKL